MTLHKWRAGADVPSAGAKAFTLALGAIVLAALGAMTPAARPAMADRHATWVEARSPNFIVVSDAGEKQARKTAVQFEQIRAVFRETIAIASAHPSPMITILALKNGDGMRELMPQDWVKGHTHHQGWFAYAMDQDYAAVELDAGGDNPYQTLYHEYYHSLTLPYVPDLPVWLAEGLAEFFGHTEVAGKEILMGEPDRGRLDELANNKMIPLNVLFKVDHTSPYYNEANKTSIFYSESWALTHYLFFHDRQTHTDSIDAYVSALQQGQAEEQAATKAFGDLTKLQATLQNYIFGNLYALRGAAPEKIADDKVQVRTLSDAEAAAYRGAFIAVAGRPADAIPVLQAALQQDPKCAIAEENLALAEFLGGRHADAAAAASQAIALGSKAPLARYLRAYVTYRSAAGMPNPQIEDDLRQAIAADPDFAPPYPLLAVYLASQNRDLTEALAFAQKSAALEPGDASNQLAVGHVLTQMRRYDEARMAGLRALSNAKDETDRAQANLFLSYLKASRENSQDAGPGGQAITTVMARGTVHSVDCANGFRMQLTTDGGPLNLRAAGDIAIRRRAGAPAIGTPCSLKGRGIAVWYTPDAGNPESGILRTLEAPAPTGERDATDAAASSAPAKRIELGGLIDATGTVTDEKCTDGMALDVSSGGATLELRGKESAGLMITAQKDFPPGFTSCGMKGLKIRVWYASDGADKQSGTMRVIEVLEQDAGKQ